MLTAGLKSVSSAWGDGGRRNAAAPQRSDVVEGPAKVRMVVMEWMMSGEHFLIRVLGLAGCGSLVLRVAGDAGR